MSDEYRLSIENGKYTFVKPANDYRVHVLRHGEPWVIIEQGCNAVFSLVHEMIDAGALAAAVRRWATPGDGHQQHDELHQAFRAYCAERGETRPAKLEEDDAKTVQIADVAHVVRNALVPAQVQLERLQADLEHDLDEGRTRRFQAAETAITTVLSYVDELVKRAQSESQ